MCDRDKRQKNLMVIFNRSCCKIEDDLGIWCRGIQLEIRKNDKGTLHLGCGQLSRKNVPPSARAENCHLLKKVDENFIVWVQAQPKMGSCGFIKRERTEDSRPARERKAASLLLTNNAKWVWAQPALTENVMEICIN